MTARQQELKFQSHILDSYERAGGYGRKWATDLQVGVPDLIASLHGWGTHLIEVKHRPTWDGDEKSNPLNSKQIQIAKKFYNAGSLVLGAVVVGETKALGSVLCFFDPKLDDFKPIIRSMYVMGKGFPIRDMLLATRGIDGLYPAWYTKRSAGDT